MNLKIKIIVLSFLLFSLMSSVLFGQATDIGKSNAAKKNSVDITLGGSGLFASANYNRMFFLKPNYFVNVSVGVGTVPFTGGISLPHQATINFGKSNSFLEFGAGGVYWTGKSNASGFTEVLYSYQLYPVIGWRKHFQNNLTFRLYINPLIHISGEYYIENYDIIPYLGISLGYKF